MQLVNKIFTIEKVKTLDVKFIETFIFNAGYEPLRWAIIKAKNNRLVIEAVVILAV